MKIKRPYNRKKAKETRERNKTIKAENASRKANGLKPLVAEKKKKRPYKYTGLNRGRAGRPLRVFRKKNCRFLNIVQSKWLTLDGEPCKTKKKGTLQRQLQTVEPH